MTEIVPDKTRKIAIIAGCTLMALVFILLVFGGSAVHPENLNWVANGGGDNFQHYIGWRFFRNQPWNRYFLFMKNLNYPVGSSVIVMDSNPLFSLIFKALSPWLPERFQFNGLWILLCYALIGLFSALIGLKMRLRSPLIFLFCGFALLNPVILQRAAIHDTLAAHWLLLAGILLFLYRSSKWNAVFWGGLLFLTLLIHVYFVPMLLFLLGFQTIWQLFERRSALSFLLPWLAVSCALIIGYYGLGYQHILPQTGSYGELSMNLNAFINPDGNALILHSRETLPLQYEGFNYWGVGLLLCFAVCLFLPRESSGKQRAALLLYCALFLLFALSQQVVWDRRVLFTLPIPSSILEKMSIFRSSGRLGWPFFWLALTFVFWTIHQNMNRFPTRRTGWLMFVCACLMVQAVDLSPMLQAYTDRFHAVTAWQSPLVSEMDWAALAGSVEHLAITDGDAKDLDAFALFAADHALTYNKGANARGIRPFFGGDPQDVETELKNGTPAPATLYILLTSESQAAAKALRQGHAGTLDGYPYLLIPAE